MRRVCQKIIDKHAEIAAFWNVSASLKGKMRLVRYLRPLRYSVGINTLSGGIESENFEEWIAVRHLLSIDKLKCSMDVMKSIGESQAE
jgi:hypothetical protein